MGRFFRPVLWLSLIACFSAGFFVFINKVDAEGPPASVMINEFKINPTCAGGDNEYIELWNTTGSGIDLTGWKVNSAIFGDLDIGLYLSSASIVIPANGLLLIEMGCSPANNSGDILQVKDALDNTIYGVSYGDMDPGMGMPHSSAPGLGESSILTQSGTYMVTASSSKGWFNDAVDYTCDVTSSSTPPTLSSVDACLSSEDGVNSNLGEFTNYTNVTGLYFEKPDKGQIYFEGALNLTDQTVVTNIANLGQKMALEDGVIAFDSEMAEAMGETGAALEMYNFDDYGYNGMPEIYVYDDDGLEIEEGDMDYPVNTSTIEYTSTGTLIFSVEHFTEFGTGPSVVENAPVPSYSNTTTPDFSFGTNVTGTYVFLGDCASSGSGSTTNGNNTITLNALSEAYHSNCAVKVIDGVGNSTTLQMSPFTIDVTAPQVADITPSAATITRSLIGAGTYTLTVSFDSAMDTSATPTIAFDPLILSVLTNRSYSWVNTSTYRLTADVGDQTVEMAVTTTISGAKDLAGNEVNSYVDTDVVYIDLQAPSGPDFDLINGSATTPLNGTNPNPSLDFSGMSVGDFLEIYNGASLIKTVTTTAATATVQIGPLADGTYNFSAKLADSVGNRSVSSEERVYVLDTTPPPAPTINQINSLTNSPIYSTSSDLEIYIGYGTSSPDVIEVYGSSTLLVSYSPTGTPPAIVTTTLPGEGIWDIYAKSARQSLTSTASNIYVYHYDATAPVLSSTSASDVTFTSATLNFTTNESGTYYYLVYLAPSGGMLGGFPSAAKVKAQGTAVTKGTAAVSAGAASVGVTGLTASKLYNAYVIVEDAAGNLSAVSKIPFGATIQSMIDAASPGDTINIPAGTYNENITINKAITLLGDVGSDSIGAGPSAPVIIDSVGNNRTVNITVSGVTFRGFIVENNGSSYPAVRIATNVASTLVKNNTLRNAYSGITFAPSSNSNTITKNEIYSNYEGLFLNSSVDNVISYNNIYSNSDQGIEFVGSGNAGGNDINNNDIYSNAWHGVHLGSYLDTSDGTIVINSNTIRLNGRAGVRIEDNTSGVSITGNTIESNGQNEISTGIHTYTASGNTAHGNTIISDNSDVGIENSDTGNIFDATMNWWGYASGPFHSSNMSGEGDRVSNDVNFSPWYGEAGMTSLEGVPVVDGDNKSYTLTVEYSVTSSGYNVTIPAGTTVTGTSAWDGSINPPTSTTLSNPPSLTGYTTTMGNIIEVGFPDVKLVLSNAAKLTFPGQKGKKVGYSRAGISFTEITTVCGANSQSWADANLGTEGDCKIDQGNDLVVWTKHFTVFATYTQTSNGGGGGSGGGGGTLYNQIPPTSPSVVINNGASSADSVNVTLTLSATNATEMAVSNLSDFAGSIWEPYATSKSWTLSSGAGEKTVYVKFRAVSGAATGVVTDAITLTAAGAATTENQTTGGTETNLGVPLDPNSKVILSTAGTAGVFQPGGSVSFGYQYKNETSSTLYIKIVRDLVNSKGTAVKKLTAYRTIKAGSVFKADIKEMLSPNLASGIYTMRVKIYNARTGKLLAENSFKIMVKAKNYVFSALPEANAITFTTTTFNKMKKVGRLPATVTLRYSYTNLTDKKQSIKMVRELIGPDGKVLATRSGRWYMVPGEKDSSSFIQYLAKKWPVGDYKLRVRALDYATGAVLAENSVDFKIEMR